jgi:antitoxin VapB
MTDGKSETDGDVAKLFMNGRSQAVRLPRAFRFAGNSVRIRRDGDVVVLEPIVAQRWPAGYWNRLTRLRRGLDLDSLVRPPDSPPAPRNPDLDR